MEKRHSIRYNNYIKDSSISERDNSLPVIYLKYKEDFSKYLNKNQNTIKLLVNNSTLQKITASEYLIKKNNYKDKKKVLTPIPYYSDKIIKSEKEKKELNKLERNAVCMRRIEYSYRMEQNKIMVKYGNKINEIIFIQKYIRGYLIRDIINDVINLKKNIEKIIKFFNNRLFVHFFEKIKKFLRKKNKKNKSNQNGMDFENKNNNFSKIMLNLTNEINNSSKKINISNLQSINNTNESEISYKIQSNNHNSINKKRIETINEINSNLLNQLTEIQKPINLDDNINLNKSSINQNNTKGNNNNGTLVIQESISNSGNNLLKNVLTFLNNKTENSENKSSSINHNLKEKKKDINFVKDNNNNTIENNNNTIKNNNKEENHKDNIIDNFLSDNNNFNYKSKPKKNNLIEKDTIIKTSRKNINSQLPTNKFLPQNRENEISDVHNQTIDYFINRKKHNFFSETESSFQIIADNFITPVAKINYDSSYERTNTLFSNFNKSNKSNKKNEEEIKTNKSKVNDKISEEENYKIIENFDISDNNFNKEFSSSYNINTPVNNLKKNTSLRNNFATPISYANDKRIKIENNSDNIKNEKNKNNSDKNLNENEEGNSEKQFIKDIISSKFINSNQINDYKITNTNIQIHSNHEQILNLNSQKNNINKNNFNNNKNNIKSDNKFKDTDILIKNIHGNNNHLINEKKFNDTNIQKNNNFTKFINTNIHNNFNYINNECDIHNTYIHKNIENKKNNIEEYMNRKNNLKNNTDEIQNNKKFLQKNTEKNIKTNLTDEKKKIMKSKNQDFKKKNNKKTNYVNKEKQNEDRIISCQTSNNSENNEKILFSNIALSKGININKVNSLNSASLKNNFNNNSLRINSGKKIESQKLVNKNINKKNEKKNMF